MDAAHQATEDIDEASLVFYEQDDGRKVSRLPNGKVVLVDLDSLDNVQDGDRWFVRLEHRETFAIAHPVEKLPDPEPEELEAELARIRPSSDGGQGGGTARPVDVVGDRDRVALFVDGANMDGTVRNVGYFLDYAKTRQYFTPRGRFFAAHYYAPDYTDEDPQQVRFLDFLSHNGYVVETKPVKTFTDKQTGEERQRCEMDVEIAVDLVNTANNYDVAFLFSGDGDLKRAVQAARSKGKRVYVVSSRRTLSRELAYAADKPIFWLEEHQERLERTDRTPEDEADNGVADSEQA